MVRPRHSNVVPGQHIYAYCNVKTHQVLYSLTRTLQHRQLQQLPDTGANNNPPNLRKDLWRPLWSIQLPNGDDGVAQGLLAYRMLRDFRVLHETMWEPPKSMSVPYTAEQIERLEKKLDGRGGSKKENAYDLIARKKWKMRVKMVMDQKANSIADLAAVLLKQDTMVEEQVKKRDAARRAEAGQMVELAELWKQEGGAAKKELEAQIQEWKAMQGARKQDRRWRKLNGKVDAARLRLAKMKFAAEAVILAKEEAQVAVEVREQLRQERERKRAEMQAEAERKRAEAEKNPSSSSSSSSPSSSKKGVKQETAMEGEGEEEEEPEIHFTQFLPSFPLALTRAPLTASKTFINPKETPKRNIPPVFSSEGKDITIRWANTLDAEYAAEWPSLVRHEPMGMVRNTAPRADSSTPFLDVAEFKAVGWRSRREGFPLEPTLAEKVLERREAMGLVEHATLKNKFTKKVVVLHGECDASARMEQLEELKRFSLSSVQSTSSNHAWAMENDATSTIKEVRA